MSREAELLGQVIASIQGQLECALDNNNRLNSSIEANRIARERADRSELAEIERLNSENAQLRNSLDRAIAELRLRIKDQAEFDGVFNSLNRIHR